MSSHAAPSAADTGDPRAQRARRVDARRNLEAIIEAAAETLAERPRASVQQIAEAAGLHRATVHRHFAGREELVDAVRTRAFSESAEAVKATTAAGGSSAVETLERVLAVMLGVSDRYRLYRFTTWRAPDTEVRRHEIRDPLTELLAASQKAGALRGDLSVEELAIALRGLIEATLPELAEGRMTAPAGAAFIRAVLSARRI